MGVTLSQIAANTASLTFHWANDPVTVEYYPGRVTEKALSSLNAFANMNAGAAPAEVQANFDAFNEMLANLLKSWDVLDDSVNPPVMFPIDAQRLSELPFGFRMQVLTSIMQDIHPEAMAPQIQNQ